MTMTWTGRQLRTLTQNGKQNTYKYDVDGLRLEKTAGGVTTQYQYVNGQLLGEKRSNGVVLRYTYDALGVLSGIQYKNAAGVTTNYIVRCTLSGDVDQIFDTKGSLVARYIYDTWGNTLSVTDASGKAITDPLHIASINPIRYRGYYYDAETGLYYLQSRYYDTTTRRFLNADTLLGANAGAAYNLFAYCGNNPVNAQDDNGQYPVEVSDNSNRRPMASSLKQWIVAKNKQQQTTTATINRILSSYNDNCKLSLAATDKERTAQITNSYLISRDDRIAICETLAAFWYEDSFPKEQQSKAKKLAAEWVLHNVIYDITQTGYIYIGMASAADSNLEYFQYAAPIPIDVEGYKSSAKDVDLSEYDDDRKIVKGSTYLLYWLGIG